MSLHICSSCRRHVKATEDCPFCARARRTSTGVGVALAFAATAFAACAKDAPPVSPDPATAGTTDVATHVTPEHQGGPAEKPSQPEPVTVPTTTSAPTAPTSVASAKPPQPVWNNNPQPVPTLVRPDRPIMARYGVAPNFRD